MPQKIAEGCDLLLGYAMLTGSHLAYVDPFDRICHGLRGTHAPATTDPKEVRGLVYQIYPPILSAKQNTAISPQCQRFHTLRAKRSTPGFSESPHDDVFEETAAALRKIPAGKDKCPIMKAAGTRCYHGRDETDTKRRNRDVVSRAGAQRNALADPLRLVRRSGVGAVPRVREAASVHRFLPGVPAMRSRLGTHPMRDVQPRGG